MDPLHSALKDFSQKLKIAQLKEARKHLSEHYQSFKGTRTLSQEEKTAYVLTRMPATYAASLAVLRKLQSTSIKIESTLDLGAGTGAASWAASHLFALKKQTLVEEDFGMTQLGKTLGSSMPFSWHLASLFHSLSFTADLTLISYVLAEMPGDKKIPFLKSALATANQALVLIEPGTPQGYENILLARDFFLAEKAHIIAPCPHAFKCPLTKGDWCHFAARLNRTKEHRELKSGTESYEDEKYSYLIVSKASITPHHKSRILRRPKHGKGHLELFLCTPDGTATPKIFSKKEGDLFKIAKKADWGDLI